MLFVSDIMPILLNMQDQNIAGIDIVDNWYLRELATIHLNLGRRTGKTSYILNNATGQDLVFVPNLAIKNQVYNNCRSYPVYTPLDFTLENSMKNIKKYKYKTAYVDEPYLFFKSIINREQFYSILDSNVKRYIFLGE